MILLNRYVSDKLSPSNGYINQNITKKLKVFFKLLKFLLYQLFLLNKIKI